MNKQVLRIGNIHVHL